MEKNISQILRKKNIIILDVRTKNEFCSGHLCKANNIPTPLPPITQNKIQKLYLDLFNIVKKYGKNKIYIVYCKKGIRANYAYNILSDMGVKTYNIGGVIEPGLKLYMEKNPHKVCYCLEKKL